MGSTISTQCISVMNRQTDKQTDRQTDGQILHHKTCTLCSNNRWISGGKSWYPVDAKLCVRIKLSEVNLYFWCLVCNVRKYHPAKYQRRFTGHKIRNKGITLYQHLKRTYLQTNYFPAQLGLSVIPKVSRKQLDNAEPAFLQNTCLMHKLAMSKNHNQNHMHNS